MARSAVATGSHHPARPVAPGHGRRGSGARHESATRAFSGRILRALPFRMISSLRAYVRSTLDGDHVLVPSVIVGVLEAALSLAINVGNTSFRSFVTIASLTTFILGLLVSFTLARTRERLALIQSLLTEGNSGLFTLFQLMEVFPEADRDRIRLLIDQSLVEQIDYPLKENHRAGDSLNALVEAVYALQPESDREQLIYREVVETSMKMSSDRSSIETVAGQGLSPAEWSSLLLLLAIFLVVIGALTNGSVLSAVVLGALGGAMVALMVLLRKLDMLRWHERTSIWEPTERLFRMMGSDPYVPRSIITSGRFRPRGRVRVADYADGRDHRQKTVTLEEYPTG